MTNSIVAEKKSTIKIIKELGLTYVDNEKRRRQGVLIECTNCLRQKKVRKERIPKLCGACGISSHGMSQTRLYKVWNAMKQRCYNKSNPAYKYYGGRGITMCEEWHEFDPFYQWSLNNGYTKNLTIDRENNNKNYTPDNCRWETMNTQCSNRRVRSDNKTGYAGVVYDKNRDKYIAKVSRKYVGHFDTVELALDARNKYILENNSKLKVVKYKG